MYSTEKGRIELEKLIDIEKVIGSKSPALLKALPKFIIRYLKRIIHQDELNKFISDNGHKRGLVQVDAVLEEFGTKITTEGIDNIPDNGRFIIAANHPLGGIDGLALMKVVGKIREDIVFPVNDILMNLPGSEEIFIPINKHGSNAQNVKKINDAFESDKCILFFPAGLVSRKNNGKIADLPWKKTFISKAKKYDRVIIPAHINGRNSNFFYNLANLRKWLGLKANLEMLYLVDEMYKQNDKNINITFGKPIHYNIFDKRMNYADWAEALRKHIYELEKDSKAEFNY